MTGTPMTAEDLLRTSIPDKSVELIRGVLVIREPPGYLHGDVAMRLSLRLAQFVEERALGRVLAAETGFQLQSNPDTVRAADAAFVSAGRIPPAPPEGYLALAPDLVIEVLSPGDRAGEVLAKVGDWLEAGTRLVWVVDPRRRVTRVYRQDGTEAVVAEHESVAGENVLPGFSFLLSAIL